MTSLHPTDTLGTFDQERGSGRYDAIQFQADSALIRELGERLVGAPHIALAELVKNAYDADATRCTISLDRNRIVVSDNGHGMTEEEFADRWMTIGTTNKQRTGLSRYLGRNVSGSKGVGRLSTQFLAHKMQMVTVAREGAPGALHALVDWDDAVTKARLTQAQALYRLEDKARTTFPAGSSWGTTVVMERTKHDWDVDDIRNLGRDLWMLQSPFDNYGRSTSRNTDNADFQVSFETSLPGLEDTFAGQMQAAIENDIATISGELTRSGDKVVSQISVRFRDGEEHSARFVDEGGFVGSARWQIRVYNLAGRQESGVAVDTAREYFRRFGVMMYDAGFRLPYYGAKNDWLGIEYDHSHRRKYSDLLPESMRVQRALNDLPSQGRLLGVVSIDTGSEDRNASDEQHETGDYLKILVTRDRLVDNKAFAQLRTAVRRSLDFYATRQRIRVARTEDIVRPERSPAIGIRVLDQLIREAIDKYPYDDTIAAIQHEAEALQTSIDQQLSADNAARSLLGPLASAGMAALAMEHENVKEVRMARSHVRSLRRIATESGDERLETVAGNLEGWLERFDATRQLFSPLLNSEDRDTVEPLAAGAVIEETIRGITPLVPDLSFETDVPRNLILPSATFAEWYALLQNVMLNASNSMLDVPRPRLSIVGERDGRVSKLRISDVGSGIDLDRAKRLFSPFERDQHISDERRALALGGMGLGLTIVRMIADQRGCSVGFVQPEPGFSTTFEMSWR